MVSERMQRQIDRLLDDAEAAVHTSDWSTVAEKARAVLAIDETIEDAVSFLKMAEANGIPGAVDATSSATGGASDSRTVPASPLPSSFVSGRYRVLRLLGEGARKRVYLAHDERLDRDVASAVIRTEVLDAMGRERVQCEARAMAQPRPSGWAPGRPFRRAGTHRHAPSAPITVASRLLSTIQAVLQSAGSAARRWVGSSSRTVTSAGAHLRQRPVTRFACP